MITVKKVEDSFERISGNPTLKSLDGTRKARLAVIMHESWTDEERAEFGIYREQEFNVSDSNNEGIDKVMSDIETLSTQLKEQCGSNKALVLTGLSYPICFTLGKIKIGCQEHTIEQWESFEDKDLIEMGLRVASKFWKENRDFVISIARLVK